MFKEYPKDVLRRMQLVELEILKDFMTVCQELKLPCCLLGGGAIGAVRHKGFIPWDDDLDFGMLQNDFDVFLKEGTKRLEDQYEFCYMDGENDFPLPTLFICKKGTKFIDEAFKNLSYDMGIRIEIFPLNNVSDNEKERKKQIFRAWFWQKLYMIRKIPEPLLIMSGFKRILIKVCCKVVHYGMKLFCISPKWIYKKYRKYADQYSGQETEFVDILYTTYPDQYLVKRSDLFPTAEMEFEGVMVPLPGNYDAVLTKEYGDYMQLPPVEQRRNHYPFLLSFGDEETGEL